MRLTRSGAADKTIKQGGGQPSPAAGTSRGLARGILAFRPASGWKTQSEAISSNNSLERMSASTKAWRGPGCGRRLTPLNSIVGAH